MKKKESINQRSRESLAMISSERIVQVRRNKIPNISSMSTSYDSHKTYLID